MKSTATDVPASIAQAPAERQAALHPLRSLSRQLLADYKECILYGMPSRSHRQGHLLPPSPGHRFGVVRNLLPVRIPPVLK